MLGKRSTNTATSPAPSSSLLRGSSPKPCTVLTMGMLFLKYSCYFSILLSHTIEPPTGYGSRVSEKELYTERVKSGRIHLEEAFAKPLPVSSFLLLQGLIFIRAEKCTTGNSPVCPQHSSLSSDLTSACFPKENYHHHFLSYSFPHHF